MVDSIEVVSRISGKWEAEVRRRVLYATSFLLLYTYAFMEMKNTLLGYLADTRKTKQQKMEIRAKICSLFRNLLKADNSRSYTYLIVGLKVR